MYQVEQKKKRGEKKIFVNEGKLISMQKTHFQRQILFYTLHDLTIIVTDRKLEMFN
jgi:hypothetical protein